MSPLRLLQPVALVVALASAVAAQAVDLVLVVGDGSTAQELRLGLDPSATSGIDPALGEAELPPLPPSGVFEARFVGGPVSADLGQGSYRDYRTGAADFVGAVAHALQWQLGSGAEAFVLTYALPERVSVVIEDAFGGAVLRETLTGSGVLRVTNAAITQATLTVTYDAGPTPGTLTAVVRDRTGPFAGVSISLTGTSTGSATTGADGRAVFAGLQMGEAYALTARLEGAAFVPSTFSFPRLTASTEVTFVRSASGEGGSVSFEASGDVGTSGGAVAFMGGGRVDIPAGAVSGPTTIVVGTFDAPPAGIAPAGPLFYFGPAGATFSVPVILRVPYTEADVPAGTAEADLQLVRFDEATGSYSIVTPAVVDTDANVITAEVTGFSGYGAALPEPGVGTAGRPQAGLDLAVPAPNPSASDVRVRFEVAEAGPVRLSLYDGLGRRVALLAEGPRGPGGHEVSARVAGLPAGVYLLRLETEAGVRTRTLTVVR